MHHAFNVKNEFNVGGNILANLVKNENDSIVTGLFLNELYQANEAFFLVLCCVNNDAVIAITIREVSREKSWGVFCCNHVGNKVITLNSLPRFLLFSLYQLAELIVFPFAMQHVNETHYLLVSRSSDT